MKIKSEFALQQIGSSYIAVATGKTSETFHNIIQLNETAAYVWKLIENKNLSINEIVDLMLKEYNVSKEMLEKDVQSIIDKFNNAGVLENG